VPDVTRARLDVYRGKSPTEVGAYSVSEAAWYLQLPTSTVRSWVSGRPYPTRAGTANFIPIIEADDPERRLLSFRNLIEIHVLSSLRRQHQVRLDAVRATVNYLRRELGTQHPLAERSIFAGGREVFVEHYGKLINFSRQGQLAMSECLGLYLERIRRNASGAPVKLYPFARDVPRREDPKVVVIDPTISFGRPCIDGRSVRTSVIADRYKAGETRESLADDFSCTPAQIDEAVRYEFRPAKAAA
jgi:uncharacterized protein (DUF433 family)